MPDKQTVKTFNYQSNLYGILQNGEGAGQLLIVHIVNYWLISFLVLLLYSILKITQTFDTFGDTESMIINISIYIYIELIHFEVILRYIYK